jgi:uncharacterized protein (DUF983 family)
MAYHESHERLCPACGERMSATAPKCLNCGRYVDDDSDGENDAPDGRSREFFLVVGMFGVATVLAVAIYFVLNR